MFYITFLYGFPIALSPIMKIPRKQARDEILRMFNIRPLIILQTENANSS